MYKFSAASDQETIVFGSAKPGHSDQKVCEWIEFMKSQGIQQVCCLLPVGQLSPYSNLLKTYQQAFGDYHVCWSPIRDFELADLRTLTQKLLPFLSEADQNHKKTVVHCGGGIGRTGHVLAAWLVYGRGFSNQAAIAMVKKMGRNPYEAAIVAPFKGKSPLTVVKELETLLNQCRLANRV